ncbi:MAG: DUF3467 domain-containing protein [Methanothrix sp.]
MKRDLTFMEFALEIVKSDKFRQIYAVGAMGGHSPYDFRIAFYNDSPKAVVQEGKQLSVMERKVEAELILSPMAAKELADWLNNHMKEYERQFGEIKKPGGKKAEAGESAPIQGYM